jgi:hypothetical protein
MALLWDKAQARQFKAYQAAKTRYDKEHEALMGIVTKAQAEGKGGFYEKVEHKNLMKAPKVHVTPAGGVEAPILPIRGRLPAPQRVRRTKEQIDADNAAKAAQKEEKKSEKAIGKTNLKQMRKEEGETKKFNYLSQMWAEMRANPQLNKKDAMALVKQKHAKDKK